MKHPFRYEIMWVATTWIKRHGEDPVTAVKNAIRQTSAGAESMLKDKTRPQDHKAAKQILKDLEGQTPEMLIEKYGEKARKEVDDHDKAIAKIIAKGKKPRLRQFESMTMKRARLKAAKKAKKAK